MLGEINIEINKFLELFNNNEIISKTIMTSNIKLNTYQDIIISISGGSDSDIMIDIAEKIDHSSNIKYVFFDTGIEYEATKKHLNYLEEKYGISIIKEKAVLSVLSGCKKFGLPFLSKRESNLISRLQKHEFNFKDEPFDVLIKRHPNCRVALRWWCNDFGDGSKFNINRKKYLKEFMIKSPPTFLISDKCCDGAKKKTAKVVDKKYIPDVKLIGIRKSEGGARSTAYKNCFTPENNGKIAEYRPLFFWKNADKKEYEEKMGVIHSDCYSKYGLTRTGCAGCPFGSNFEKELEILKENEPKLYVAIINIFHDSYEYMRKFNEYRRACKLNEIQNS